MPATAISGYTYAPQEALIIAEEITTNKELDLSAQNNIKGITDKEQTLYILGKLPIMKNLRSW